MLKTPEWGMMIVLYFFFGGIAGGAYFTAAIADNIGGPRSSRVALVGYLLSLPLVALCGLLLIAVVLFLPEGAYPRLRRALERRAGERR